VVRADDERLTRCALAAAKGDRQALEEFVRDTQRDVWRVVAHLAHVSVADDLAQETFLRALPALARFEGRSSARTWLFSIARRVAADHLRSASKLPRATSEAAELADARQARTAHESAGFEDIVELNIMLDSLDAERREALVLTQVLGLSYSEVADICGCPIGTVRSRVARARDDLLQDGMNDDVQTGAG
jgi:RNA polymerase sigma-70 factor (ECF subfamily)